MGAGASIWLAIGLALFFAGAVAVVFALCRMALRQGAEVEGEIKAPSLRLKFRARPPGVINAEADGGCPHCGSRRETPAARVAPSKEK